MAEMTRQSNFFLNNSPVPQVAGFPVVISALSSSLFLFLLDWRLVHQVCVCTGKLSLFVKV